MDKIEEDRKNEIRIRQKNNMDIFLISNELVMDFNSFGICKCIEDIYTKPILSFYQNKNQRMQLNVPKQLTVNTLIYNLKD